MCGLQDFFVYNTDELNIYWSLSSSVWIQVIYVRQMTSESPGWSVCVGGGCIFLCLGVHVDETAVWCCILRQRSIKLITPHPPVIPFS